MDSGSEATRVVNDYLSFAAIEKGLSKNTVAAYRRDLEKFVNFLELKKVEVQSVDHSVIDDFLGWMRGALGMMFYLYATTH